MKVGWWWVEVGRGRVLYGEYLAWRSTLTHTITIHHKEVR